MIDPRAATDFLRQADGVEALGSPFTAGLIRQMHGDLVAGGPVAALIDGWRARGGDAMPVRIAAAIRFGALSGLAPKLRAAYPDGEAPLSPAALWPEGRAFLQSHMELAKEFIRSAPQTNETGRAAGLLLGFKAIADTYGLPLEILELGASAGLNLLWDAFAYRTSTWSLGEGDVVIEPQWRGPPVSGPMPQVVARAGCDLNPLDIADERTLLRLRSYIWPDQADRLRRFDQAVALAGRSGTRVEKASAEEWLSRKLAHRRDGVCTVVYHSLFFMYPPRDVQGAIQATLESCGAAATARAPLAWLRYEPEGLFCGDASTARQILDLVTWPGGERRVLAVVDNVGRVVENLCVDGPAK